MKAHIFSDKGYIGTIIPPFNRCPPEIHFPIGGATTRIILYREKDISKEPIYYVRQEGIQYIRGWV